MRKSIIKSVIFTLLTLVFNTSALAAKPMWSFDPVPGFPPYIILSSNEVKAIKYTVTNQTKTTRTLSMLPIEAGVSQITTGTGVCGNPFVLPAGGSCILSLSANGNLLQHSIMHGPTVCPLAQDGKPSPFQCFTPSKSQSLNIFVNSAVLTLHTTPSPQSIVGLPYSQVNIATGGTRPYTFKVSAGNLPGVTELLNDGTVYGIIRTRGIFAYVITVTDALGASVFAESSGIIIAAVPDNNFPYGAGPQGDVCIGEEDYYATPETMLGSWAMQQAVELDHNSGDLPDFIYNAGVVYAVGTASLGKLGIPDCPYGCNQLNGFCFAIRFLDEASLTNPYMIFQSVDTAALNNSFDVYLAGGGSGAFPESFCNTFWGVPDGVISWKNSIQNTAPIPGDCNEYFNDFTPINSAYSVIYQGVEHPAKETLMHACSFAHESGYNRKNFSNLQVVPVTCPQSLTQVTGVKQNATVTTIGNATIQPLSSLTSAAAFTTYNIADTCSCGSSAPCDGCTSTTQMQDCKTPSAGYCYTVTPGTTVPNYHSSISATLENPILVKLPPSVNYCTNNPTYVGGYCSWNNGGPNGDPDFSYCSQSKTNCIGTGADGCSLVEQAQWCTCTPGGTLANCTST